MLRASGDPAEMLLAWGLADQLFAGAGTVAGGSSPAGAARGKDAGAMAVGAQLVEVLGDLQTGDRVVMVVVDDLHWADEPSARALLFALRRMQADRVLALVSVRPGGLTRLGEGWSRFAWGDHRVTRLRLGGLSAEELAAMARSLGFGDLSGRSVAQLLDHTGGNALHCRALLEELGPDGLARAEDDLPAPRELAGVILARLKALSEPAQGLVTAAAVLGRSSRCRPRPSWAALPIRWPRWTSQPPPACSPRTGLVRLPLSPSPIRWFTRPSAMTSDRPSGTTCTGSPPRWFRLLRPCPPRGRRRRSG